MCSITAQISFRNLWRLLRRGAGTSFPSRPAASPGAPASSARGARKDGFRTADQVGPPDCPPFGAITRRSGVRGRVKADDLRRARTPADPIRPRHTVVGPAHTDLARRGSAEWNRGRHRLRVRLHRPGRRRTDRRGGRGRRYARRGPGEDDDHPDTVMSPHADAHPHTDTHTASAEAHAAPDAHPDATGAGAGAQAAAHSCSLARAEARTAPAVTGPTSRSGGTETPGAHPEGTAQTVAVPGELSAVSAVPAWKGAARRSVPRLARPARHRARAVRRRRAASALTPGGTSCRNGLFSPSRWRPPASSCSS